MGLSKSKGPRVYEPYTSFDVLPTEYFNRRQYAPQATCGISSYPQPQMVQVMPQQCGYQGQQPSSIQMPQSQVVYNRQQYGQQAPQSTQVFAKPTSGAVQYVQVKSLPQQQPQQQQQQQPQQPSTQPISTYAPSQINQQQQPQQQPIVRGSSGGISMPASAYYMSTQQQRQVIYGSNQPQQMQSVPKFSQQPQVQVVGQRIP